MSRSTTAALIGHRESVNRGHAERPLSNDEMRAEVLRQRDDQLPAVSHAEEVCEQVLSLDRLDSIRSLEDLLARDPSLH